MSSEVGRIAFPFNGPYSMTKYAVEAFSDSLRRELAFLGMKVVIIQPGAIKTRLSQKTAENYKKYKENSHFKDEINRVWDVLDKERYADPIFVAKAVHKAIHKKNPKRRYRIKNNKQRRLLELVPQALTDFLIYHFI